MKQRQIRLGSLAAVLFLCGLSSGCVEGLRPQIGSTPTLSRQERYARIGRNWGLEYQMINDDIDTILLLRPASGLTQWSVP